jgi:hypothetical protein
VAEVKARKKKKRKHSEPDVQEPEKEEDGNSVIFHAYNYCILTCSNSVCNSH